MCERCNENEADGYAYCVGAEDIELCAERVYAGGTRYHRPTKLLRRADGLYRTVCGQRGWVSDDTSKLAPCRKCY